MKTKFQATHNMTYIGKLDVPVVVLKKTTTIRTVANEEGQQFLVGKYNVEEVK